MSDDEQTENDVNMDDWADALEEQAQAGDEDVSETDGVSPPSENAEQATAVPKPEPESNTDDSAESEETSETLKDTEDPEKAWFDSLEKHDAEPQPNDQKLDTLLDAEKNLDVILDIPVSVSMEIGRTRLPIRNLLRLNQGSVVELDRLAGEPLDVLVNGTLIAHGEVVVVNDKYGIRLTDVISPAERVRKLK